MSQTDPNILVPDELLQAALAVVQAHTHGTIALAIIVGDDGFVRFITSMTLPHALELAIAQRLNAQIR